MLYLNTDCIQAVNNGEDLPETLPDPITGEPAFKLKWTPIDGWRGHYDSTMLVTDRWQKLDSDWVTGEWGDAGEHKSSTVKEKLEALAADKTILAIFMPTSNVFSTRYDVYQLKEKGQNHA